MLVTGYDPSGRQLFVGVPGENTDLFDIATRLEDRYGLKPVEQIHLVPDEVCADIDV